MRLVKHFFKIKETDLEKKDLVEETAWEWSSVTTLEVADKYSKWRAIFVRIARFFQFSFLHIHFSSICYIGQVHVQHI